MDLKKFSKNDSGFACLHCGKTVEPLKVTSRNHCPYCLYSLHVDINPGDRENECGGLLKPVSIEQSGKKGYVIVFKCLKCGQTGKNKAAGDDDFNIMLNIARTVENN